MNERRRWTRVELVNAQRAGWWGGGEVEAAPSTSASVALWGEQTPSEVSATKPRKPE